LLLSKVTRQHVTVVLSGDGGDELFAGYNRYLYFAQIFEKTKLLPISTRRHIGRRLLAIKEETLNHWAAKVSFALPLHADFGLKLHKAARTLLLHSSKEAYNQLLSHWPAHEIMHLEHDPQLPDLSIAGFSELKFVEQIMALDASYYLPEDIMTKVDRSSMHFGLETRSPFLDHRLHQFLWELPLDYKIKGSKTKRLLKDLLAQYGLAELTERPKQGFSVPLKDWLRSPLKDWASDLISSKKLTEAAPIDVKLIEHRFQEHIEGKKNWGHQLWDVLVFLSWCQSWL